MSRSPQHIHSVHSIHSPHTQHPVHNSHAALLATAGTALILSRRNGKLYNRNNNIYIPVSNHSDVVKIAQKHPGYIVTYIPIK